MDTEAAIESLYHVPENGKAEVVNGKLVVMAPTGGLPGYAGAEIFASLREYARRIGTGYAVTDNVGFIVDLPNRKSFSPDAAFYTGELSMRFLEGRPCSPSRFVARVIMARRLNGTSPTNAPIIFPPGRWWSGTWTCSTTT